MGEMGTEFHSSSSLSFPVQSKVSESQLLSLPPAFTLVSFSTYSETLKMEAMCSSKMSLDFQWTIQRYISGDIYLDYAAYKERNKDNYEWLILGLFNDYQ
jgi:hypothetical protein